MVGRLAIHMYVCKVCVCLYVCVYVCTCIHTADGRVCVDWHSAVGTNDLYVLCMCACASVCLHAYLRTYEYVRTYIRLNMERSTFFIRFYTGGW